MTHPDTFGARSTLTVGDTTHEIYRGRIERERERLAEAAARSAVEAST